MIRVNCSTCGKRLKCPEDAAGKSARCPKCGSSVALHSAAGADLPVIEPAETLPSVPVILMLDDDDPPKALPRRRRKKRRFERDERNEQERDEEVRREIRVRNLRAKYRRWKFCSAIGFGISVFVLLVSFGDHTTVETWNGRVHNIGLLTGRLVWTMAGCTGIIVTVGVWITADTLQSRFTDPPRP